MNGDRVHAIEWHIMKISYTLFNLDAKTNFKEYFHAIISVAVGINNMERYFILFRRTFATKAMLSTRINASVKHLQI